MRHKVFGKKLNRDIKERKALFKNLINSFLIKGEIVTTYPKAKAVRGLIEKIVTHAKDGSNSAINKVATIVNHKSVMDKLVNEIAPKFKDRAGGYIEIVKLGRRRSDNAEEVRIRWSEAELQKKNPQKTKESADKKK